MICPQFRTLSNFWFFSFPFFLFRRELLANPRPYDQRFVLGWLHAQSAHALARLAVGKAGIELAVDRVAWVFGR